MNKIGAILGIIVAGLTILAGIGTLLAFFIKAEVAEQVKTHLAAQDLATDSNIVAMNTNIAANAAKSQRNAEEIADNKQAVRDAFQLVLDKLSSDGN